MQQATERHRRRSRIVLYERYLGANLRRRAADAAAARYGPLRLLYAFLKPSAPGDRRPAPAQRFLGFQQHLLPARQHVLPGLLERGWRFAGNAGNASRTL